MTFLVLCIWDPTELADISLFASLTTWPETLDTSIRMHNMGKGLSTNTVYSVHVQSLHYSVHTY